MNETILSRMLDRVDEIGDSVAGLTTRADAIVERLDRINGSVQKHEADFNEMKIWRATHEQNCKPKIQDATIIKITGMICLTTLTLFGAKVTGLAEALLGFIR